MNKNLNSKKLLIFAKHLDGGTGTFVEQLATLERVSNGNIRINIIALERPEFRQLSKDTIQIKYFSNKKLLPYAYLLTPSAFINFIHECIWFRNELRRIQPDFIISIDNHCNVLSCLSKLLFTNARYKIILTIHNNISAVVFAKLPFWSKGVFKKVCRYLFSFADEIVGVSEGVALDVQHFFSLKKLPKVIYVAVDIAKIQKLSKLPMLQADKTKFSNKNIKIISVGRLAPQKDFKTIIEAMTYTTSNTQLFIIGEGTDKSNLLELIRGKKLEKRIHFLGWRQNIYPFLKASDIFILSSHYEGFPFALLEAAALEKPIIATDTPYGPKEFLGDNLYGIIIPMGQPEIMSKKIISLSDKKVYRYYQQQLKKRIEMFSEKTMLTDYLSLIAA